MKKIYINQSWNFRRLGEDSSSLIDLPHDAMFYETRNENNHGGKNVAWFDGGDYEYEKTLEFNKEDINSKFILEFEGVYKNAEIFVNEVLVCKRPYGYTNFDVDISDHISFDNPNTIKVIAKNSDQPNSRWYSGSGIYRPVSLIVLPKEHIVLNSVKIRTVNIESKTINVSLKTTGEGPVTFDFFDKEKLIKSITYEQDKSFNENIELPKAKLWDLESPNLYSLKVTYKTDQQEIAFGIREISVSAKTGFLLNRKRVIMKGACIHHDNGILGANGHPYADKRKARILKDQGFNSIRSAHNPISKAFLDECDRIGLLVVDEYVDMWYIHKTKHDYADYIMDWWQQDLLDMVNKDYNHPSVVMYSIGNEVSETSEKRGIEFTKDMTEYLHDLDYRPVTCGVNIFFNYLYSLGFGVYTDKKADKAQIDPKHSQPVGSEFFNTLAGKLGDKTMKLGAWLPGSDRKTKKAFANLDVSGYNYGIMRYKKDIKKYPDRIILGSETFTKDARYFFDMAKKHPSIIGDFVWAGMDYLGEVGAGSWVSEEITKDYSYGPGWTSAGSGRIDLIGNPLSEMAYMRVAYDLDPIRIGVIPVNEYKTKHSPSAWKMTNAIENWTWDGHDGMYTIVQVYTKTHHVSLMLDNMEIGNKKTKKNGIVQFKVKYFPGLLKAVGYDSNNEIVCQTCLETGNPKTILTLKAETASITQDELAYVKVRFTDENDILNPLAKGDVTINVSNGSLMAFGNACPYNLEGYHNDYSKTYYGEALAIIKPKNKGIMGIHAISPYGNAFIKIQVK